MIQSVIQARPNQTHYCYDIAQMSWRGSNTVMSGGRLFKSYLEVESSIRNVSTRACSTGVRGSPHRMSWASASALKDLSRKPF